MICTNCLENKSVDNFSRQMKNPSKFYRWCDSCRHNRNEQNRKEGVVTFKQQRYDFYSEMRELKAKAQQNRKIDDATAVTLKQRYESGVAISMLASEYGVSGSCIRSNIKRVKN